MDFFDDPDDAPQRPQRRGGGTAGPPGGSSPGHAGPPNRQQARVRQLGFLIGAVVILILIVIAFRGCLNARKDRSFENYVSDLSSIVADTGPLSTNFFDLLDPNSTNQAADEIGLQNEVNGDAGASQGLLDRANGLDPPDELGAAQTQIVLAYELRHDALAGIATQLDKAGGSQDKAVADAIYTQMKVLSASDILFARARSQVEQALADQGVAIADGVPSSQFLPDQPDFLDPTVTADAIGSATGISGSGGASDTACKNDGQTHGLGLAGSSLLPSQTALVDGGSVTVPGGDDSIEVSVQNQGDADESGIDVSISGDGGIAGSDTIQSIAAGETQTATLPLKAPAAGQTVELTVDVATVGCEQVAENNTATYSVTF